MPLNRWTRWFLILFGIWINRIVLAKAFLYVLGLSKPFLAPAILLIAPVILVAVAVPLAAVAWGSRWALLHLLSPYVRCAVLLSAVHLWLVFASLEFFLIGGLIRGGVPAPSWIALPFALILLIPVFKLPRIALGLVRTMREEPAGFGPSMVLGRSARSGFWEVARACAAQVGVRCPDNVLMVLEPVFCVTDAPLRTHSGLLRGRTLVVSLPLLRVLSQDELRAVIVHEFGHLKEGDLESGRRFHALYRRLFAVEEGFGGLMHSLCGVGFPFVPKVFSYVTAVIALPGILVIRILLNLFAAAERQHSRTRELEADHLAGEIVGAKSMALALVKVHAYHDVWGAIRNSVLERGVAGLAARQLNLSLEFEYLAKSFGNLPEVAAILSRVQTHPFDTHPPLAERLASLMGSVPHALLTVLHRSSDAGSSTLIPNAEAVETELSCCYFQAAFTL